MRWGPLGVIWWLEAQAGERVFRFQLLGSADSDGSQERGEDMRVLWGLEGLGLDGVPVIPMAFPLPTPTRLWYPAPPGVERLEGGSATAMQRPARM